MRVALDNTQVGQESFVVKQVSVQPSSSDIRSSCFSAQLCQIGSLLCFFLFLFFHYRPMNGLRLKESKLRKHL